jgi:iron complex outermembrane receptor protein
MNNKILLLIISLFPIALWAQSNTGIVNGTVTAANRQPASYVNVLIKGTTIGISTDETGSFSLESPEGSVTLVFTGIGFAEYERAVEVVAGQTLTLDVQLSEQVTALQTVEITGRKETTYKSEYSFSATKTQVPVKDIPQTISTITKELITDQQSYRLQDVVKNVSGANQFSVYDDITIRGFRSSENRLLNGLRFSGNFWTSPLLVNIERIEVIKGPASAMFGNTNPGGTINMVTKKPLDETRGTVQISAGSFKTTRATADFTGAINENKTVLYRLNLGYENSESFRDLVHFRTLAIAPSISYVPNNKTRINFDLNYQDINTVLDRGRTVFQGEQNLEATPVNFNLTQPGDFLRPKVFSAALSWSQQLTDRLNLNVAFLRFREDQQLQEHRFSRYITPDSIRLSYTDRIVNYVNDNVNAYLTYRINTGNVEHTLLGGYDLANLDYNFTENQAPTAFNMSLRNPTYFPRDVAKYTFSPRPLADNNDQYSTYGFYIQDQIKYHKLQLLLSLRHERYNIPKTSANAVTGADIPTNATLPRVGVVYSVTNNTNLYATYNQGFQVPDPYSIPFIVGGNPQPLTSVLYEAGVKSDWFNKRFFTTLSLYNLLQNNVITNANDPANPDALVQRGQERARGVELELVGNPAPNLSIILAYAYNDAIISKDSDEKLVGLTKENAPLHNSSSWIRYTFTGSIRGLGLGVGHSHNSVRNGFRNADYVAVILPSYVVFNAMAYYQVDKMRISLNVNNLTDETFFTGGYNFERNFPGAPRNYLVSVAYSF